MPKRKKIKNYNFKKILFLIIIILLLSIFIPILGSGENSPTIWIKIVDFFTLINNHFKDFWMFYSFGLVIFLAQIKK